MKVMKFGGTSVGKPERMYEIAKLITKDDEPKIVVLKRIERHNQFTYRNKPIILQRETGLRQNNKLMRWNSIIRILLFNW